MELRTFADTSEWIDSVVEEILRDISPKEFSLAFSGGSTPALIYQALAWQDINWEHAHIFQVDERFVAPDKKDSNALLILQNFVDHLRNPGGKIHFFETTGKIEWKESAVKYDVLLRKYGKPFDVCILGIGPDGHIASLFPGEPAIRETEKLATISETNQFAVWKRLTLTFSAILSSKKLIVLLRGNDKKETLEELLKGSKSWEEFPSKKLLEHKNLHVFFLEE